MIADRLRKAVLQAAIEGKLTEQLSEDGNAIDLLKQIKTKNVVKNDIPFEIPENWIWTKLGVIGKSNIGLTYKPENIKTSGTLVLRSSNIQNGILTYDDNVFVELDIPENKFAQVNDILICARNGSKRLVGKAAIIDKQGMSFGAFMSIYRTAFYNYVYYYLQSPYFRQDFDGVSTTTINQITQSNLLNRLIPLPPFEEQKRIVEKLEVLLAEIDKLEQDEKALKDLEDKFPEKLKNAIIQAAIEGKLVDNSTKESAFTELDEKTQRLYLNNKDKYKLPFDIPNSWILMPIFQSYEFVKTGVSIYEGEKKYFSTGSIKEEFKPEGTYTFENRPSRANRLVLKGDIIEAKMSNTIKTTIVNEELDNQLVSTGFFQIRINSEITTKYVYYLLQSPYFTNLKNELSSGTTQKAINDTNLSKIIIPIPPAEEQKSIVEKLDKLFAIDLLNI